MKLPINYNKVHFSVRKIAREQYIREQEGKCYHCECSLESKPPDHMTNMPINRGLFPEYFFDWPIHLHHDHDTGMTIGAVHAYCNAVLWQYHGE